MTLTDTPRADDRVVLRRRSIDTVLSATGGVLTLVFVVAGALLLWGSSFSADYVDRELGSQNVYFPSEEELRAEGRDDLVSHAGEQVNTGDEAEAYASYIDGHLANIAGGQTYAELSGPESAARAALQEAQEAGEDDATIEELQAAYDEVSGQRSTLFRGETLRGLLLSAYAWATVGSIAGWAAWAAWAAAVVMLVLTALGLRHRRQVLTAG
ncbi:MAG: hypothetical protein ACK5OX_16790 [Desertimonas sp.]